MYYYYYCYYSVSQIDTMFSADALSLAS